MKILLTGSTGMVGRNILEHKSISNYILLTPSSKELNLLNYGSVIEYLKKNQPDFVIHTAGKVGGIQANLADPVGFLTENLDMARNLILGAKACNVPNFLNLSSSCVYPRNAVNPLQENLLLTGELEPTNEGYALAKIIATRLCEYISGQNENFRYKTALPCNLYGKYDKFDPRHSHMLPAVVKKIHDAKTNHIQQVEIWGDGLARREFMYAGDLADFIIYAIENFENMPQNLNVGLGKDFTINEYYKEVANVIEYKGTYFHDLNKPIGMKMKLLDITLLQKFGWKAQTTLSEGIEKTYKYYLKEIEND